MKQPTPFCVEQLVVSKRILVLGSSGSGKTYFSRQLGQILDIQPIHLDAHLIRPGWVSMPQAEWRRILVSLIQKERWIMDGTYERTLDLRLPAADMVVVIESPRLACFWRVIKRKLTVDDAHRPDAPPGQRLDRAFLRYIWRYPTVTRPAIFAGINQYGKDKALIILKSPKETNRFITRVRAEARVISPQD